METFENTDIWCFILCKRKGFISLFEGFFTPYTLSIISLMCEKLKDRLCVTFAKKTVKHEQCQSCKMSDPTPNFI